MFWGCSRYPKCTFTTSREPVGAVHDVDAGVVARNADGSALCLKCGAAIPLPATVGVGELLAGGPAGSGGHRTVGSPGRPARWRGARQDRPVEDRQGRLRRRPGAGRDHQAAAKRPAA